MGLMDKIKDASKKALEYAKKAYELAEKEARKKKVDNIITDILRDLLVNKGYTIERMEDHEDYQYTKVKPNRPSRIEYAEFYVYRKENMAKVNIMGFNIPIKETGNVDVIIDALVQDKVGFFQKLLGKGKRRYRVGLISKEYFDEEYRAKPELIKKLEKELRIMGLL